ncbi:MAG: hypothetical protein ACLTQI_08070 [Slackia sp.]
MKPSIQKLLVGFVIVIVLAFILLRGDQLVELVETMKKGAVIPLVWRADAAWKVLCAKLGVSFHVCVGQ